MFQFTGSKIPKNKIDAAYHRILSKIDPYLVYDVLLRMQESPMYKDKGPMYTVEVFTKQVIDSKICKDHMWTTTGKLPGIYDKGAYNVTHMRLTPEILIKLNYVDYVLQVMADYTRSDASMGPMHEVEDYDKRHKVDDRNKRII